MADSSVAITAGAGTPIRVLTGLGPGAADQQVVTLGDTSGNLVNDPVNSWQAALTLTTTTSTAAKAAGAAGIRNYVTGLTLSNAAATATLVQVLDGATVIWQAQLAASQAAFSVVFETPLRGTAATAMNVKLGTAVTSVYASLQGFTGS